MHFESQQLHPQAGGMFQQHGIPQQHGMPQQGLPQQHGLPHQGLTQQQAFMPQAGAQHNMPYTAMQQPQQMHQQLMGQQASQLQNLMGTQPVMPEPPPVVSTKDHLYLKDSMSWTLTASKKYHMFAMQCLDPEIKAHFEQAGQMHQRHYNILLKHTRNSNNP